MFVFVHSSTVPNTATTRPDPIPKEQLQSIAGEQRGFLSLIFKLKVPIVTTMLTCELEYGTRILAWFQFISNCFIALVQLTLLMTGNLGRCEKNLKNFLKLLFFNDLV